MAEPTASDNGVSQEEWERDSVEENDPKMATKSHGEESSGSPHPDVKTLSIQDPSDPSLQLTISDSDHFARSVFAHPKEWFEGLTQAFKDAEDKYDDAYNALEKEITEHIETTGQVEELKELYEEETNETKRLRNLRNNWFRRYQDAAADAKKNAEEVEKLKRQRRRHRAMSDDSMDDNRSEPAISRSRSPLRDRSAPGDAERRQRRSRSPGRYLDPSYHQSGHNRRYPDPKEFTGESEDVEYEAWKLHVQSKLRQSAAQFPSTQDKIDYVRDLCKKTAFDIVRDRANYRSRNAYRSVEEMFHDLDEVFAPENEADINELKLRDPKFKMGAYRKDETLDEFLQRFRRTIRPIAMTEHQKVTACRVLLPSTLEDKMNDGTRYTALNDFVAKLRRIYVGSSMQANSAGDSKDKEKGKDKKGRDKPKEVKKTVRRPPHIYRRCMKEGLCLYCGERGHQHRDKNRPASCREPISDEALEAMVSAFEALVYKQPLPSRPAEPKN